MKALYNENKLFVSFRVELKFNYIYENLFLFSFPWIFNSRCDLRVDVDNCFRLNELVRALPRLCQINSRFGNRNKIFYYCNYQFALRICFYTKFPNSLNYWSYITHEKKGPETGINHVRAETSSADLYYWKVIKKMDHILSLLKTGTFSVADQQKPTYMNVEFYEMKR